MTFNGISFNGQRPAMQTVKVRCVACKGEHEGSGLTYETAHGRAVAQRDACVEYHANIPAEDARIAAGVIRRNPEQWPENLTLAKCEAKLAEIDRWAGARNITITKEAV